jgi:hypothetical protein
LEDGALNLTVAEAFPATADGVKGAEGTVAGVTALEGAEGVPLPSAFVA